MDRLRKFNRWLIAFTIISQPFIDVIRKLGGAKFEILGMSALEIANILLVGSIFILTVITYPKKKKLVKWLWLVIPYLGYFALHYYNVTQFNTSIYPEHTVSIVQEFYYLFRMFVVPLVLVFSAFYSGIKKKELFQIFEVFILLIAGSICLLNILKISFMAYDTNIFSMYSILDWFTFEGSNYQRITTKGWFSSGNQVSAIMLMTLPITLYLAYSKRTKYNYFLLILQILAMLMLGTKVANMGCVLVLIAFFVIIIFKKIVLKKTINPIKWIVLISIGTIFLFYFSPRGYELRHKDNEEFSAGSSSLMIAASESDKIKEMSCLNLTNKDKLYLELFVHQNRAKLKIPDYFISSYPTNYNHGFWCYITKQGLLNRNHPIDYREMKTGMLEQIYIENNRKLDKWVGLGYTLNFIYTEEDYTYQFFSYGILGLMLFFGPYIIFLLYLIYLFFKNFKNNFTVENVFLIMCLAVGLAVPYLSGHVFERLFPLYTLAFIVIINLANLKNLLPKQLNKETKFKK